MWSLRFGSSLPALLGEGSAKGQWPLLAPIPGTSVSLYIPLVPFKLPPQCWSTEGASLSRWVRVRVPQEEPLRAPAASSTNSIPTGFLSPLLQGLIFLALEPWAGGPGVGLGLLAPKISLLNFYPCGCGTSCSLSTPSDQCGWRCFPHLHSCQTSIQLDLWCSWVTVALSFRCNLVRLCKEASLVCLCRHLDQKPRVGLKSLIIRKKYF